MASLFELKVIPSSGKQKATLDKSGTLKIYLKNPAEKGLANKELIKYIAKSLSIPQKDVLLVSGQTNRKKRMKIVGNYSFEILCAALGIELQKKLFT